MSNGPRVSHLTQLSRCTERRTCIRLTRPAAVSHRRHRPSAFVPCSLIAQPLPLSHLHWHTPSPCTLILPFDHTPLSPTQPSQSHDHCTTHSPHPNVVRALAVIYSKNSTTGQAHCPLPHITAHLAVDQFRSVLPVLALLCLLTHVRSRSLQPDPTVRLIHFNNIPARLQSSRHVWSVAHLDLQVRNRLAHCAAPTCPLTVLHRVPVPLVGVAQPLHLLRCHLRRMPQNTKQAVVLSKFVSILHPNPHYKQRASALPGRQHFSTAAPHAEY